MTDTAIPDVEVRRASSRQSPAAMWLIVATGLWGISFTWTKTIVELIPGAAISLTGFRLMLAGLAWFTIFSDARRDWHWRSIGRGVVLGAMLALGLLLQTAGLAHTSVAVSSFLTSLTVLFVPLIAVLIHFHLPSRLLLAGVLMATVGIWLLTGATPAGFGWGEVLGLACAFAYSFHILLINVLLPRDDAFRLSGMMLLSAGLLCLAVAAVVSPQTLHPMLYLDVRIWPRLLGLVTLGTLAAFGIQMVYQPRIDPTRAAMLYLLVPIFAAIYAYFAIGERLTPMQIAGATLIIAANVLVEALARWSRRELSE